MQVIVNNFSDHYFDGSIDLMFLGFLFFYIINIFLN